MTVSWGLMVMNDTDFFQEALQEWRESSVDRAWMKTEDIPTEDFKRILARAQQIKQERLSGGREPQR